MKNLDDIDENEPSQPGEVNNPEDELPASPEEVGVVKLEPGASEDTSDPADSAHSEDEQHVEDHPHSASGEEQDHSDADSEEALSSADLPEEDDIPVTHEEIKSSRRSWLLSALLGLLILLIIVAISAFGGYRSGIVVRQEAEGTQLAVAIKQQYDLGVEDFEQGNYYRARQRFEYVIHLDPMYPGASEKLSEVLFELNTTATPTLVPTPTLTPTPDSRGEQELFDQGHEYLRNSEWDNAINTLLSLRKINPDFQTVQVDGMLFISLRNRGKDKVLLEQDLEGGIYDLTLAEQFGVLDTEADGILNWTRLYITGASFWQIDWGQAAYYFGQVAPHLPNLMDKSGLTAGERYRTALIQYGYYLANQKEWCKAAEQFQLVLSLGYDAKSEQDYNTALERCAPQQETNK